MGDRTQHICLRIQCAICDRKLKPDDRFIPLACGDTVYCLQGGFFFDYNFYVRLDDQELCWKLHCWRCKLSPEAVAIHLDCWSLFENHCRTEDVLDRLWIRSAAQRIWRGAPALQLDPEMNLDIGLVHAKAAGCGIAGLNLLPPELIRMVYEYSKDAVFWRYVAIVSLSKELRAAPATSKTLPLCSISTWTRGAEPSLSQPSHHLPVLRLTIDYRGLAQVERLPERPPYRRGRSDSMAYVILTEGEDDLENIIVHYKYGISYLEVPGRFLGFHIWDMPNPPLVAQCHFLKDVRQSMRFRTVDVRSARGLSFLYCNTKLYGIYGDANAAQMKKAANQTGRGYDMPWIYLPIPEGEEITAIVLRMRRPDGLMTRTQTPCFLFRMKLAGDVSIGPYHTGSCEDVVFSRSNPELLIHNAANVGIGPVTLMGTYNSEHKKPGNSTGVSSSNRSSESSDDARDSSSLKPFDPPREEFGRTIPPPLVPANETNPLPAGYLSALARIRPNFSFAPLENITAIHVLVFEMTSSSYCQAVVLDYENGARRALGHYRSAARVKRHEPDDTTVYPSTTWTAPYRDPARFCYKDDYRLFVSQPPNDADRLVQVESGRELPAEPHGHDPGDGWVCSPMQGILKMWFWEYSTVVSICPGAGDNTPT